MDTIVDKKTGYLFSSEKEFVKDLIHLLKDDSLNVNMGKKASEFVRNNFEADNLIIRWIDEIESVYRDEETKYLKPNKNYFNDHKWLKLFIRFIRFNLKIRKFPDYETIKYRIKRLIKK